MLYWGIFTAGYILGVVFTLYIFLKKEPVRKAKNTIKPVILAPNTDINTDKIFDQLTQVNTFSNKNINKSTVLVGKIQIFLSRIKTAIS